VPEKYVKISGEKGIAEQGYVARDLSAFEGVIVRVERLESGWALGDQHDRRNWLDPR